MWYILLTLAVVTVLSAIEYRLANLTAPWPGAILPGVTALVSIVVAVGFSSLNTGLADAFVRLLAALLYMNIPTAALLVVYFVCRKRKEG